LKSWWQTSSAKFVTALHPFWKNCLLINTNHV
jgi:hypothetical protein